MTDAQTVAACALIGTVATTIGAITIAALSRTRKALDGTLHEMMDMGAKLARLEGILEEKDHQRDLVRGAAAAAAAIVESDKDRKERAGNLTSAGAPPPEVISVPKRDDETTGI